MAIKRTASLLIFLFAVCLLHAQKPRYELVNVVYLSKVDSAIMEYAYPVFSGFENKTKEERLNKQISSMVLPDSAVLDKLELLKKLPEGKLANHQLLTVDVTYMDDIIICLQTRIRQTSSSMPGAVGDMYYDTYSIASGNEYFLNNLFTSGIDEAVFNKYKDLLIASHTEWEHYKEHVVGFGLISSPDNKSITLQVLVNSLYSQEGPMPLELSMEEFMPYLNQNGPLYKAIHQK